MAADVAPGGAMPTSGPAPDGSAATSRVAALLTRGAGRSVGALALLAVTAVLPRGDLFGTPRVTALVADAARAPTRGEPARLVADLVAAVRTFREPVEPADDVTLLAVQWLGPADAGEPADAGLSAP